MKHTLSKNLLLSGFLLIIFSVFLSCKDDEKTDPKPVASFTHVVTGLSVQFTNTSKNYVSSAWTFSDAGSASTDVSPMHTFSAGGVYKVTLVVTSKDGSTDTEEKSVVIEDVETNLLLNSTFVNNENWTVTQTFSNLETEIITTFSNKVTVSSVTAGNEAGVLIYQAVYLTPGDYKLAANVSTEATQFNSWILLHLFSEEPVDGFDPDDADVLYGFDGCNEEALVGDLASVGNVDCKTGTTPDGVVSITTADTYYFAIGIGIYGGAFGNNFNINSVSLIEQ